MRPPEGQSSTPKDSKAKASQQQLVVLWIIVKEYRLDTLFLHFLSKDWFTLRQLSLKASAFLKNRKIFSAFKKALA